MTAKEQVWDPLRKKMVALTPEENVRQWFIYVLEKQMLVPKHMMMSEVSLQYGETLHKKDFRADIVVFDRRLQPMLLVECKRAEVELTEDVVEQALRYNMVLDVRYIAITNGNRTYIFRRKGRMFEPVSKSLTYEEMLSEVTL